MTNKSAIFEKLESLGTMPTPSRVALEIMRLCRDSSSSLEDIARVVETDPALASKILKFANSVLLSPGMHIASIHKATVKLGMSKVRNLALGFSLLSQNTSGVCKNFDYKTFWAFSLARAVAARTLTTRRTKLDPDELFVCALLAHIGSLAFASLFPEDYANLLIANHSRTKLAEQETKQFGLSNHELSGELFTAWGLPENLAKAVVEAELPKPSEKPVDDIEQILRLAGRTAEICMQELPLKKKIEEAESEAQKSGIQVDTFEEIFDEISENWQKWGHVFQIPVPECPLYRQIKEQADREDLPDTGDEYRPTKVLVVDDDPMTLLSLENMLTCKGREVFTAEDGEQALSIALQKQPHMIITDWRMPKISGLELCSILRKTSVTCHIYIIMLTGRESDEELIQALDAGADDFVIKPFTPRVLEARINSGERIIRYQQMLNKDREVIEKYAARLASANRKLQTMAMTDTLTGLPNRRSALNRLKEVVAEAKRHQEPLACIMIDIDRFKDVNDNYGHDAGDLVLKETTRIFQKTARSYDMVSRMGGEEFLVICARSSLMESRLLAERLRLAVSNEKIHADDKTLQITISLGVAAWNERMLSGEEMIKAADRALYRAKQLGRNRVEVEEEIL